MQVPRQGATFFTWDPVEKRTPNRTWRRWGTDRLVRAVLGVVRDFARDHPNAPRVGIGDLSRIRGGDFGPRYGKKGHVSHQNGLDVDVYYPRRDGRERRATEVEQIDHRLAQDLVDRFAALEPDKLFVGPNTGLTGEPGVVTPLANHDDHLHFRLRPE